MWAFLAVTDAASRLRMYHTTPSSLTPPTIGIPNPIRVSKRIIARSRFLAYLDAFEAKYPCERLGKLSTILQMGVTWATNSVSLSQERQIKELAAQYGETESNPIWTPMDPVLHLAPAARADPTLPFRSLLGSLMWISRCTRPDICFAVTYLSHFCTTFSHAHFAALKRILRYLFHTRTQTLTLSGLPAKQWPRAGEVAH